MNKYTNQFNIKLINFDSKYKVIGVRRFNGDTNNCFFCKSSLLESGFRDEILSLYFHQGVIYFLFDIGYDTSRFEQEISNKFEVVLTYDKLYKKELITKNLILNMLGKKKINRLTNVGGNLLKIVKKKNNSIVTIEFEIKYGDVITFNVSTFSKYISFSKKDLTGDYSKYILKGDTLEVASVNEKKELIYIKKNNDNNHNVVPFFELCKEEKFRESKMGHLLELLEEVDMYLKDDIKIEYKQSFYEETKMRIKDLKINKSKFIEYISQKVFNIINKSQSNCSSELITLIKSRFNNCIPKIKEGKQINKNMLNIVIVDKKEDYEKNNQKDKYMASKEKIIQHIYPDTINESYNLYLQKKQDGKQVINLPEIDKILYELCIKEDVIQERANLASLYHLQIPNWTFVCRERINKEEHIAKLTVFNNTLIIEDVDSNEWTNLISGFKGDFFDKLIIIGEKKIAIEETKMTPIPDLKFYSNRLEKLNRENKVDKDSLVNLINEEIPIEYRGEILDNIKKHGLCQLTKQEVHDCFRILKNGRLITYNHFGDFVDLFEERTGILLDLNIKRRKHMDRLVSGFISLQYKKLFNDYFYYVGKEDYCDFNTRIATGAVISKLTNISDEEFREYCSMLKVDFLKTNSCSKYPFPFKYLREYLYMKAKSNKG